jgi:hypothetical protein
MEIDYKKLFLFCCKHGYLTICQNIYSIKNTYYVEANYICYEYGQLQVLKWLYELEKPTEKYIIEAFYKCCEYGHLTLCKWLYENNEINIRMQNDDAFICAARNSHLPIIKWLISIDNTIDIHMNSDFIKVMSCKNGHLEMCKWLYENGFSSDTIDINVLSSACEHGNILLMEWALMVHESDIEDWKDLLFKNIIIYGHLHIMDWLLNKCTIDITVNDNYAFKYCCEHGHLKNVEYLYKYDNMVDVNKGFYNACTTGHLKVAMWLYDNTEIDIDANDHATFKASCRYEYIDIMDWLCKIVPSYTYGFDEDFGDYCAIIIEKIIDSAITLNTCCICLEDSDAILDCKHDVCVSCLEQLEIKSCPLCRKSFRKYYVKN